MIFFTEEVFLTELNFFKGDTNIYFKQITFFEKKDFLKIIHIFFLKIVDFKSARCKSSLYLKSSLRNSYLQALSFRFIKQSTFSLIETEISQVYKEGLA